MPETSGTRLAASGAGGASMKKLLVYFGAAVMALGLTAVVADDEPKGKEKKVTVEGYVSDSMCGLDHNDMMKKHGGDAGFSEAACVAACVKGGAKYIIADRDAQKTYNVKDQKKVAEYAGKRVHIEGKLEEDGNTLDITKISLKP